MKLVYFSVSANEIPNLSEAARIFCSRFAPLDIHARTRTQLEAGEEARTAFVRQALAAVQFLSR